MTSQQTGPTAGSTSASSQSGYGFGTAPVFLASISTILSAILFLRFGYAVAHVGLWGSLMIIVIGHLGTIPTVLAVSEIATNRRVAGGGAYYILLRWISHRHGFGHCKHCSAALPDDFCCGRPSSKE